MHSNTDYKLQLSQEMEYTRAKWTRYGGHMIKAKGEHNS